MTTHLCLDCFQGVLGLIFLVVTQPFAGCAGVWVSIDRAPADGAHAGASLYMHVYLPLHVLFDFRCDPAACRITASPVCVYRGVVQSVVTGTALHLEVVVPFRSTS